MQRRFSFALFVLFAFAVPVFAQKIFVQKAQKTASIELRPQKKLADRSAPQGFVIDSIYSQIDEAGGWQDDARQYNVSNSWCEIVKDSLAGPDFFTGEYGPLFVDYYLFGDDQKLDTTVAVLYGFDGSQQTEDSVRFVNIYENGLLDYSKVEFKIDDAWDSISYTLYFLDADGRIASEISESLDFDGNPAFSQTEHFYDSKGNEIESVSGNSDQIAGPFEPSYREVYVFDAEDRLFSDSTCSPDGGGGWILSDFIDFFFGSDGLPTEYLYQFLDDAGQPVPYSRGDIFARAAVCDVSASHEPTAERGKIVLENPFAGGSIFFENAEKTPEKGLSVEIFDEKGQLLARQPIIGGTATVASDGSWGLRTVVVRGPSGEVLQRRKIIAR